MIVIYTQDKTLIHENADAAKQDIIDIYGNKLGMDAYKAVKAGRLGTSFRRYGGPLIRVVNSEKAAWIREKEKEAGMIQ